jgi:3-phosphoshikimate 1-carboxyvinyltransferase
MDVTIRPSTVSGTARAPPSKSYTHRAILAAGYAPGGRVHNPLLSADTRATIRAVEAFGGSVEGHGKTETAGQDEGGIAVDGFHGRPDVPDDVIDCENSGTTMRLATATAALADGTTVLTGDESLRSRPQGPLLDAIEQLGGRAESTRGNGRAPVVVEGPIDGGTASMPGDVSSQFVTALLFAGASTGAGIEVHLETALKSAPYVDVTLDVLEAHGVTAEETADGYRVSGGGTYAVPEAGYAVPGDFSSMSYLLAAGALVGEDSVRIEGAWPSAQGDTAIVDVLRRMGADVDWDRQDGTLSVSRSSLSGITVDVGDTPDLLPTIAVLGAVADGTTHVENCEHVRYKETDRVAAMKRELTRLGARVEASRDKLSVYGSDSSLRGTRCDGYDDHRIVMALSVAGLVASGETTIAGRDAVDVSFPDFFDVLSSLGGDIDPKSGG